MDDWIEPESPKRKRYARPLPGFASYRAEPRPEEPSNARSRRPLDEEPRTDERDAEYRVEEDGDDVGARFTDRDGDGVDDRLEAAIERRREANGGIGGRYDHILGSDEQLLMRTRIHPFAVLGGMVGPLFFALLTLIVAVLGAGFYPEAATPIWLFALSGTLLALIGAGWRWISWRRQEFLVTDRRIVRTSGVFNLTLAETALEKVNDMRESRTFFGRIFDYGDLEILTASDAAAAIDRYHAIAKPVAFRMTINEAKRSFAANNWRR